MIIILSALVALSLAEDCWQSNKGILYNNILHQEVYTTMERCQELCVRNNECQGVMVSPMLWAYLECFLLDGGEMEDRNMWNAASKTCFDKGSPCFQWDEDLYGGDLGGGVNTVDVEACKDLCMENDECMAFNFVEEKKECWLKGDRHSERERSEGSVSGKKSCFLETDTTCSYQISNDYWELVDVEYESAAGIVEDMAPEVYGEQHIDNEDGSGEQKIVFTISETVTETASYTHKAGVAVKVGTAFSCGVPVLAKGEVSVEVTANYEFTYGTTESVAKTISASYWCVAPAGRVVTCKALMFKYNMDVPYKQTWRHKVNGQECVSEGKFNEVAQSRMVFEIDEENTVTGGLHFRR